ncbi:phycobiliprotein lyase [Tumidithrix helvetica PCC 7403]|uniref:phycobiliprotein lyase n=1 Tax=Tumidithrix helvetica TaxID=3457545 RepID=UPI003C852853
MLSFLDFFAECSGLWKTERTYHMTDVNEIERSYTEYEVKALTYQDKQNIMAPSDSMPIVFDLDALMLDDRGIPGFSIAFDTVSEKGEKVSMQLKALFVPDTHVLSVSEVTDNSLIPIAAQLEKSKEVVQGYYLRDEGYSEAGAIAGRFTYQPTRQTLEMTTYYKKSIAVDQMRFLTHETRLRTIVTYRRPDQPVAPTEITLVGFGVEHRTRA